MPSLTAFQKHCLGTAQAFVQTAIIIDNDAALGPDLAVAAPKQAIRPSGSILAGLQGTRGAGVTPRPDHEVPETDDRQASQPPMASIDQPTGDPSLVGLAVESGPLNVKALTDAFGNLSVICGIYRPESDSLLVEAFTAAAEHADILIIDWFLEPGSSAAAKDIALRVLRKDASESGRLRLIAIYTSQPDLRQLAEELLKHLQINQVGEEFSISTTGAIITGATTRICFYNKADSSGVDVNDVVQASELPGRLLEEFAVLTEGVLSTYAVASIAAVRRSVHHLIAIFGNQLDGAFLGHRCAIPHPEDASDLARELIVSEISNLIGMDPAAQECIEAPVLHGWLEHVTEHGHTFRSVEAEADLDLMKEFVVRGSELLNASNARQTLLNGPGNPKKARAISAANISTVFYDTPDQAFARNAEFSRLCSFKREAKRGGPLPPNWVPTLTLGSVLRVVPQALKEGEEIAVVPSEYLVCVQPRCDSVRIDSPRAFPFQRAYSIGEKFNLIVKDDADADRTLKVSYKPQDTVMKIFVPEETTETIRATKDGDSYRFSDQEGFSFVWVGDMRDLKAQKDASELAASMHRVGMEEFEWLRLNSGAH